MSDEKDQSPNSPSLGEESTGLPLKKRDFAGKTLAGLKRTMSSDNNDDDFFFPINKKMKLDQLQKQAYYDVLHAFTAESPSISTPRVLIMNDLMNELNIAHETHTVFEDKLKTDSLVKQLREVTANDDKPLKIRMKEERLNISPAKTQEEMLISPAKIQKENAKPSSTYDDSPVPVWGEVSPGSLVDRWVNIRMSGEDDYIPFLIAEYDAEKDIHRLVIDPCDLNDPCDWIDIRHIPEEDIIWQEGHPGFPIRKRFPKPGETLLHATTTVREKKQLREVGETASGIPIIRKLDKGKSIAT